MPRVKSVKTWRQYDSRWGRLGYRAKPYTMSGCGCGPTACANIIRSNPKKYRVTPKNTRKYLIKNGYATMGHGTEWNGIHACLRHYGFKVNTYDDDDMSAFFKNMAKTKRRAVILFRGGSKGGVTWTTIGHYVAASGYKKKNGKHYLYMHDSGPRHHDGWYCYEDTMRGLIVWADAAYLESEQKKKTKKVTKKKSAASVSKKAETKKSTTKKSTAKKSTTKKRVYPELPSRGYFKKGDKGVNVKRLQTLLNKAGYKCGTVDGVYGDKTVRAAKKLQKKYGLTVDGKVGKRTINAIKKALK